MKCWLRFILTAFATIALSQGSPVAAGDEADVNVFQRLAVVPGPQVRNSGLADLVGVELLQSGVGLVEREQLDAIVREQALDASLGLLTAAQRRRIGQFARADGLVLLREQGKGAGRTVQVVFAETRQGARLSDESFPLKTAPGELAQGIAASVLKTRGRFAHGVKAMVGVTPFLARNFTYEYHFMQSGYASLLQRALAEAPGVAVVEVEEAREIRREQEIAGGHAVGVVPVFVEGEYEVKTPAGGKPRVQFKVLLRTAGKSRQIERNDVLLEEAPRWIARDLAGDILPEFFLNLTAFSPAEEIANLSARADAFAALGETRHAADLRSAALVIDPQDAKRRDALLDDSRAVVESLRDSPLFGKASARWDELAVSALPYYQTLLESAEWKIRRQASHLEQKPVP